jgi:hypothetical protein
MAKTLADYPQINTRYDDDENILTARAPSTWAWPRRLRTA